MFGVIVTYLGFTVWHHSRWVFTNMNDRCVRLFLCVIQEVNVKQLRDAAVLISANLLFTRGHLTDQTWWRLSPRRPRGATGPPVAAVGEAGTPTCGVPRPIATPTRQGWRLSRRPPTTSTMPPTEAPSLPRSPLLCPARQEGAGSTGQTFTASRTCSCRCSLLVMRRTERKWLVILLRS